MDGLLIYVNQGRKFDPYEIKTFLLKFPGIYDLREVITEWSVLNANFDYEEDSIIVELKRDLETISLSDCSKASLELAWKLQSCYDENLRIIDLDYSFDLLIKDYRSGEELYKVIVEILNQ